MCELQRQSVWLGHGCKPTLSASVELLEAKQGPIADHCICVCHTAGQCMALDMMYCSENQEAKHAANALLANRAALTQNMNFVHPKTKGSGSTHGTQQTELKNAPPESTVRKLTEPTPSIAWT